MLIKDLAICLRTVDYSETSQIITLFTKENGKIDAIAKGSKRPKSAFDGPLEIFSFGKIIFSDSNKEKLVTLTEFVQQPAFVSLSSNLFTLNCASFATELLTLLIKEYDPHPQLFDSFTQFLQNLQNAKEKPEILALLILFQLTLLNEAGLKPILNACANCKTQYACPAKPKGRSREIQATPALRNPKGEVGSDDFYFSSSANGLLCRDCEHAFPDRIKLSAAATDTLANLKTLPQANEKTLNEIEKILIYHFTETLGRPPKLAKLIL